MILYGDDIDEQSGFLMISCLKCNCGYLIESKCVDPGRIFNPQYLEKADTCPHCGAKNSEKRARHRLEKKAVKDIINAIQAIENTITKEY